jgi:cysteine synthase A
MTGLGLAWVPSQYDREYLDAGFTVHDKLSFSVTRALCEEEGLLLGASTGAIVAAGLAVAARLPGNQSILMINPDRGDRYLETVYNNAWLAEQKLGRIPFGKELLRACENLDPVFWDDRMNQLEPLKVANGAG